MKYFIDTEFIERFHKPLFGKSRHVIDLISIGIVSEDGRSYYAIGNEYRYKDADKWVRENVILPAYIDAVHGDMRNSLTVENFHLRVGKSKKQIAIEMMMFFYPEIATNFKGEEVEFLERGKKFGWGGDAPEFYGYYCDYDWVLFCSIFGRMIDLPKGFPMYCRDLKQSLDELAESKRKTVFAAYRIPKIASLSESLDAIKAKSSFPIHKNEHNAIADAKWNYELYKFLNK